MNNLVEYLVIAIYLVFLVVIGSAFSRDNKDISDYFRSGCKATWWLVGTSLFMSAISAYSFTGNAGVAFQGGWTLLFVYGTNVLAFAVVGTFLAHRYRRMRVITGLDIIRERFGRGTERLYMIFGILIAPLFSGIGLWALGIFMSSVFGFNLQWTIVVVGIIVALYSITGGRWAVLATDFIQAIVLIAMVILMAALAFRAVGGFDGMAERIAASAEIQSDFKLIKDPGQMPDNAYTWQWILALFMIQFWQNIQITQAPRYLSVKDGPSARKAAFLTAGLMAVGGGLFLMPPIVARLLYAKEVLAVPLSKPAESAYAIMSLKLLPNGLLGLMVVAMLAAAMSSFDTALNGAAAGWVKNILPEIFSWFKKEMPDEHKQVRLSRFITAILGVTLIGSALLWSNLKTTGVFEFLILISSIFAMPMTIPTVLGFFIKKVPGWSASVTVLAGAIPTLIEKIVGLDWTYQERSFWIIGAGSITFCLTAFFWKYSSSEYKTRVEAFFAKMNLPIDFEKEVGKGTDLSQLVVLGKFAMAVAAFVLLLLVLPNDMFGRLCILFVAAFIGAVGGGLLWRGVIARRRGET